MLFYCRTIKTSQKWANWIPKHKQLFMRRAKNVKYSKKQRELFTLHLRTSHGVSWKRNIGKVICGAKTKISQIREIEREMKPCNTKYIRSIGIQCFFFNYTDIHVLKFHLIHVHKGHATKISRYINWQTLQLN